MRGAWRSRRRRRSDRAGSPRGRWEPSAEPASPEARRARRRSRTCRRRLLPQAGRALLRARRWQCGPSRALRCAQCELRDRVVLTVYGSTPLRALEAAGRHVLRLGSTGDAEEPGRVLRRLAGLVCVLFGGLVSLGRLVVAALLLLLERDEEVVAVRSGAGGDLAVDVAL